MKDSMVVAPPRLWRIGEPAPWFVANSSRNPRYNFSALGGYHVALCFFGDARIDDAKAALEAAFAAMPAQAEARIAFVGISTRPEQQEELTAAYGPLIMMWDYDLKISKMFGRVPADADPASIGDAYQAGWIATDPNLRTMGLWPLSQTAQLFAYLKADAARTASATGHAPILVLPRIFEPDFCRALIELYTRGDGVESGFMREIDGRTVGHIDHSFKRRRDHWIEDPAYQNAIRVRIGKRLLPEITKVFNFNATRIERYIVACYDAEGGGFFNRHRDNTTNGTAHRKFAVTINLNAEEYEGGDLRFPEYGERTYRAPSGGAVVFSCSIMHEATKVTRGRRYACLPFLYDDAAAKIREANAHLIEPAAAPQAPAPAADTSDQQAAFTDQ
jgi:predicted 2-oxoglutarate/Fe(II)-dependent dioxygenase YbiX